MSSSESSRRVRRLSDSIEPSKRRKERKQGGDNGERKNRVTGDNGGGVAWTRVRCDASACGRVSRVSESSSESIESLD